MDAVFSALSHPVRRAILDLLREKDGRTLSEIEGHLPMTRFGVMKHLKVLEDAHLVVARKVGREKYHYLNPVPIHEIGERWISRYATPFLRTMSSLKAQLEAKGSPMASNAPKHVYEMFIRAPAEALWKVITDDTKTSLWQRADMTSRTQLREGGSVEWMMGDKVVIAG